MALFSCDYDEQNKIWTSSNVESVYSHNCPLGRIIYRTLQCHPNQICQIDDANNTTTTNREALAWATRIALHLKDRNLGQNDVIGICARNTTYVLPTIFGCTFNGIPFHVVNPMYDEATLSHCFGLTKPQILFCDGLDYEKIRQATESFTPLIYTLTDHIVGVPNILDLLVPSTRENFYQPTQQHRAAEQTVAMLCSSGTTGKPKAVCLSASVLLADLPVFNSESVVSIFTGIDWITGLAFMINNFLCGGTRIISNKPFSCEHFVDLVQKYKVNVILIPPCHIAALVENPLVTKATCRTINTVLSVGGTLSDSIYKRFRELLPHNALFAYGYGSTEFGGITINFGSNNVKNVGTLLPGVRLRVVDDNGEKLGPNEVGEILLYKPSPWNGYFGNPIESERMRDADGWYHTGDLGYMDGGNHLYLVDRKKDTLKYQGIHYWPKEIEAVIEELPDVRDVCVVGIPKATIGDAAGALVVKTPDSSLCENDVIEYVAKRLVAVHKQIHSGVYFVDEIPRNLNGKLLRNAAKEILESKIAREEGR